MCSFTKQNLLHKASEARMLQTVLIQETWTLVQSSSAVLPRREKKNQVSPATEIHQAEGKKSSI